MSRSIETKIVGVWSDDEQTFLTQSDLVQLMIQEVNFHLKYLQDDVIDAEDFAVAMEQVTAHYVKLNNQFKNQ